MALNEHEQAAQVDDGRLVHLETFYGCTARWSNSLNANLFLIPAEVFLPSVYSRIKESNLLVR
jgi:hypothetical protein